MSQPQIVSVSSVDSFIVIDSAVVPQSQNA